MNVQELLRRVADERGTPCFVYLGESIDERIEMVRQRFGGRFRISYAVKSNPNAALLRRLAGRVEMLDISSAGELRRALAAGWPAARLTFTGPGKSVAELEAAVDARVGEVIVESWQEAAEVDALAGERSIQQGILVRIAPSRVPRGFGVNMAGKPTQFGIDEEVLEDILPRILSMRALDLRGFHIYSGTQCLNVESIAENYAIFIELFRRFSNQAALKPHKLIFGSGIGIPYHESTAPVDLAALAERVNPMLDSLRADARFRETELVLEIGRYLVGEAGFYVIRVLRRKSSRGAELCICDGGMHHHLGACGHLGSVIHRNYRMFKVGGVGPVDRAYDLVGPLCTSIDTLGHAVRLPEMKEGDLIAVNCSGAYGPTASPLHFIGHAPPRELLVEHQGEDIRVIDVSEFGGVTAPDLVIQGDR